MAAGAPTTVQEPEGSQEKRGTAAKIIGSRAAIAGLLVLLLVVWLSGFIPYWAYGKDAAAVGDSFGIINTLFAGLALAGVIVAIVLQSQELGLQRKELEETRAVLEKTAAAQQRLQETSERQAESQFLAAYLTALNSLHEAHTAQADRYSEGAWTSSQEEHLQAQRDIRAILAHLVKKLEPRIEDLTDKAVEPEKNKSELLAEHVERLLARFNVEWEVSKKESPESWRDGHTAASRLKDEVQRIVPDVNPSLHFQCQMVLEALAEVLQAMPKTTGSEYEVHQQYYEHWNRGYTITTQMEALASDCRRMK